MRRRDGGIMLCGVSMALLTAGCSTPPVEESEIDKVIEDRNDNGFAEVAPPPGITFEDEGSINVLVRNTVTRDDVTDIAAAYGVDPTLVQVTDIVVFYELALTYPDGTVDIQEDTERIEPFEKRLEFACPDVAQVSFEVVAFPPLLDPETLLEGTYKASLNVDFECGQTIAIETFIDETGLPNFDISLND